jgi:hypothetical protein
MMIPNFLLRRLQAWTKRIRERRAPDFVIGGRDQPYMLRWWVIPRNRIFNLYLHQVLRSDDDRALHDHPWLNCSLLIEGRYAEHTIAAGGVHRRAVRAAGAIKVRGAKAAHRLELIDGHPVVTLFLTGPRVRSWGFHCPEQGWVHWEDFTATDDYGQIGRGCGEPSQ